MDNVTINTKGEGGGGGAKKLEFNNEKEMILTDGWFTNCNCKNPPWHLGANKIAIDQDANSVEAYNMKLYLGKIPVAYFPWWYHP